MLKKKIVHVIESAAGGSLSYVIDICEILDSNVWDITVIYSRRLETPKNIKELFPEHIRLIEVSLQREISIFADFKGIVYLKKIFHKLKPDIIHLHSSKAGVLGRLAGFKYRKKIIYTPHGFSFFRKDINKLKRKFYYIIEKVMSKLVPCLIVVGSKEEFKVSNKINSPKQVFLIYKSVDVPSNPLEIPINTKKIITIGRITNAKNPFLFLEVIEGVKNRHPDSEFVWIGDGELRNLLELEARKRGVEVQITGWVSKNEVKNHLATSMVYIQTSSWEGLPFSLLEAMAMARPIVVSDIVAHRDLVDSGVNGYIAKNKEDFIQKISELISNTDLRSAYGKCAWQKIKRDFSRDKFTNQINEIYRKLSKGVD